MNQVTTQVSVSCGTIFSAMLWINQIWMILSFLLVSCASPHKVSDVLEPVDTEAEASSRTAVQRPPSYEKVMKLLEGLGYLGVGLDYEEENTLDLLFRVFSHPALSGRKIRLVYTGLMMAYDPAHESLTVGGNGEVNAIVSYIQKHVPMKTPGEMSVKKVPEKAPLPVKPANPVKAPPPPPPMPLPSSEEVLKPTQDAPSSPLESQAN